MIYSHWYHEKQLNHIRILFQYFLDYVIDFNLLLKNKVHLEEVKNSTFQKLINFYEKCFKNLIKSIAV